MRIRNEELNVSSEEKCLQRRLETACPRTESCERSTATGSMPPDLRRRMHVRRTLSSSAELQGRPEQTTEFDLQHRHLIAQSSDKYAGASPCIALYIIRHSLNWMSRIPAADCGLTAIIINDFLKLGPYFLAPCYFAYKNPANFPQTSR